MTLPPRRVSHGTLTPIAHPQWYGRVPPPEIPVSVGRSPSWWQLQRPRILSPRRRLSFDVSRLSLIDTGGSEVVGGSSQRHPLAFLVLLTLIFILLGTIVGFLVTFTRGRKPNYVEDGETALEHKTEPVLWLEDTHSASYKHRNKRIRHRPDEDVNLDLGANPRGLLGAHSAHTNTTTLQVSLARVETAISSLARGHEKASEDSGSTTGGEAARGKKKNRSAPLRSLLRPDAEAPGTNSASLSLAANVKIATSLHKQVTSGPEGAVAAD